MSSPGIISAQRVFDYEVDLNPAQVLKSTNVVTAIGNAVSQMTDSAGNNLHVLQNTASLQPLLVLDQQNGLPAIRFIPNFSIMRTVGPVLGALISGNNEMTVFIVFKNNDTGISTQLYHWLPGNNNRIQILPQNTGQLIWWHGATTSGESRIFTNSLFPFQGITTIMSFIIRNDSSGEVRLNNDLKAISINLTSSIDNTATAPIFIAFDQDMDVDLFEIAVFKTALSDDNFARTYRQFSAKYNIAIS